MAKLARVLIMAGGTGGHVFPGLAVAKYMHEQGIKVHWLGTRQGLEARWVSEAGFPIHFIKISGFRGKRLKDLLFFPWQLAVAIMQSIRIIRKIDPDVVIGMGGFVSGPGGIASWLLSKKLVIHEQNAKPGSTNKWLAHVAVKVLEGFPDTFLQRPHVLTIGNPVRAEIAMLPPVLKQVNELAPVRHLLVLGGSLGAQAINALLPRALAKIPPAIRPTVWHQTGEKHLASTISAYAAAKVTADIVPFIVAMDKAYRWADMVLCRAGALTVTELCAAGVGAILVPFPYAVDDHQTANANFMVKNHAALLVQQAVLTENLLAEMLQELLCYSAEKYIAMAQAAYALRKVDAAEKILTICQEICH